MIAMHLYTHLSLSEREHIMIGKSQNKLLTEIANELGRNKSTISRKIHRNSENNGYSASVAQAHYSLRRVNSRPVYKISNPKIFAYVDAKFHDHQWSPQQISERLNEEGASMHISASTIYRGIYSGRLDRPEDRCLCHRKLRHRGKTRHTKNHQEKRGKIQISNELTDRPVEAEMRIRIGDWEADTVAGVNGKACLVTLVDRRSRFLLCCKAEKKTSEAVTEAINTLLINQPLHTITPDRGKEFANHKEVTATFNGVQFYFPPPHQPWKRGTNENTNGLLREYFPKGKDISNFTDEYIQAKVDELNQRPRKCLGYKTPFEIYYSKVLHLV